MWPAIYADEHQRASPSTGEARRVARSSNTGTFCSASPNRRPIRTRCS